MNSDLKKKQFFLLGAAVGMLVVFGYAFYTAIGKVSSVQEKYINTYKELVSLQEQQKQAGSLKKDLLDNAEQIEAIKQALIEQTYENKYKLVIDIENIAKRLSLIHELTISKELTKELIAQEKARAARSRKASQQATQEIIEEKFPSVVLKVELSGSYPSIVSFMDGLKSLPYYISMDSFTISSKKKAEEKASSGVEATLHISVFTI